MRHLLTILNFAAIRFDFLESDKPLSILFKNNNTQFNRCSTTWLLAVAVNHRSSYNDKAVSIINSDISKSSRFGSI